MGDFSNSVVTTAGANLFNTAVQNSQAVTITKVSTGDGTIGATDPHTLTNLISLKQNITPASANTLVAGQATFTFTIDTFAGGFTGYVFREVGIFGKIGAGAETLLTYASTATPDTLTASTTKDTYTLVLKLSTAATMTCTVNMEFTLPLHAAEHLDNGLDPLPVFTVTRTGSVPIGTGNKKQYLSGATTWENTLPVITSNTTLYVSTTGNDSTALPNDASHPWESVQSAHDWLLSYQLFPGVVVTISVASGTYTVSNTINITHPQSSQINVVGASVSTTNISAISTSGSSYILTVASATGLAVGMAVRITGSIDVQMQGLKQITGISGTQVTVARSISTAYTYNNASLTGVTLSWYPSIFQCSQGGIQMFGSINSISNFNLRYTGTGSQGNATYDGISAAGRTIVSNVNVWNFRYGISANGSGVNLGYGNVALASCNYGLQVSSSASGTCNGNMWVTGNLSSNVWAYATNVVQIGGQQASPVYSAVIVGGYGNGILSDTGATVLVNNANIYLNASNGMLAQNHSFILFGGETTHSVSSTTNGTDVGANANSTIIGTKNGGTVTSYSPANTTVGNLQSYVNVS